VDRETCAKGKTKTQNKDVENNVEKTKKRVDKAFDFSRKRMCHCLFPSLVDFL